MEDKIIECEKCGDEVGTKTVGDESVVYCRNCNWITN
jgi:formamidopyrimidine-DNA glycosylase